MARPSTSDFYQNYHFHLFDTPNLPLGSLDLPLIALAPQIGFQSVSGPNFSVETVQIRPGNSPWPVNIVKEASVGNITLGRGVFTGDSEFYDWTRQAIYGRGAYRRTLMLCQYRSNLKSPDRSLARFGQLNERVAASLAAGVAGAPGQLLLTAANLITGSDVAGEFVGTPDIFVRIWTLRDVLPVRYQAAGNLEATDDGITIQELELNVEFITEINPGPLPISRGWT